MEELNDPGYVNLCKKYLIICKDYSIDIDYQYEYWGYLINIEARGGLHFTFINKYKRTTNKHRISSNWFSIDKNCFDYMITIKYSDMTWFSTETSSRQVAIIENPLINKLHYSPYDRLYPILLPILPLPRPPPRPPLYTPLYTPLRPPLPPPTHHSTK